MSALLTILSSFILITLVFKAIWVGITYILSFAFIGIFFLIMVLGAVFGFEAGTIFILVVLLITCIRNRRKKSIDE